VPFFAPPGRPHYPSVPSGAHEHATLQGVEQRTWPPGERTAPGHGDAARALSAVAAPRAEPSSSSTSQSISIMEEWRVARAWVALDLTRRARLHRSARTWDHPPPTGGYGGRTISHVTSRTLHRRRQCQVLRRPGPFRCKDRSSCSFTPTGILRAGLGLDHRRRGRVARAASDQPKGASASWESAIRPTPRISAFARRGEPGGMTWEGARGAAGWGAQRRTIKCSAPGSTWGAEVIHEGRLAGKRGKGRRIFAGRDVQPAAPPRSGPRCQLQHGSMPATTAADSWCGPRMAIPDSGRPPGLMAVGESGLV